jgi:GAF domain-containing protein
MDYSGKPLDGVEQFSLLNSGTLQQLGNSLPLSVIDKVLQTRLPLVVQDARVSSEFANDPYVLLHNIRSVLCSPVIANGVICGIIYLENSLQRNVFDMQRVYMCDMLANSAAISLDNARLYKQVSDHGANLELQVAARTQQLEVAIKAAVRANQAKSWFLSSCSHELR